MYYNKYLKYKSKYLQLKKQSGGDDDEDLEDLGMVFLFLFVLILVVLVIDDVEPAKPVIQTSRTETQTSQPETQTPPSKPQPSPSKPPKSPSKPPKSPPKTPTPAVTPAVTPTPAPPPKTPVTSPKTPVTSPKPPKKIGKTPVFPVEPKNYPSSIKSNLATRSHTGRPPGLVNLGVSCFYNSIFQLIYRMTEVKDFIVNSRYNGKLADMCSQILKKMNETKSDTPLTSAILQPLLACDPRYRSQQDASEAFGWITSALHEKADIPNLGVTKQNSTCKIETESQYPVPPVTECSDWVDGYQDKGYYIYLDEDMIVDGNYHIDHAINYLYKPLYNTYTEETKSSITKVITPAGHVYSKITYTYPNKYLVVTMHSYQVKQIQLSNKFEQITLIELDKQIQFRIIGIVLHKGSRTGGHYIAIIKYENIWYVYNDDWVYPLSDISSVLQTGIYFERTRFGINNKYTTTILLYEKLDFSK